MVMKGKEDQRISYLITNGCLSKRSIDRSVVAFNHQFFLLSMGATPFTHISS